VLEVFWPQQLRIRLIGDVKPRRGSIQMKRGLCLIACWLTGIFLHSAFAEDQLRCQIANAYMLVDSGQLIEISQSLDLYKQKTQSKIDSVFYVDTLRGVVMGDISNIGFDKIEILNTRNTKFEGFTVLMRKLGATNYLWINTVDDLDHDQQSLIKPFYWNEDKFIYSGT
jgi:hypothetical protein